MLFRSLATMTDAEIEGLQYKQETKVNEDGEEVIRQALKPVIKKQRKQLKHLLYWIDWKSRQLNNFTHEEWMNLTSESFENFCNQTLPDIIRGSSSSSSAGRSAGQNVVTSSEVASFKKSIDKSQSDFPQFNGNIAKWIPTKQTYLSVAANHGISRKLDDSEIGQNVVTSSEVASFKESIDKTQSDFPQFNGNIAKWIPTKQTYLSVAANHGISRILDDSEIPAEDAKDRELFNAQNQYFQHLESKGYRRQSKSDSKSKYPDLGCQSRMEEIR